MFVSSIHFRKKEKKLLLFFVVYINPLKNINRDIREKSIRERERKIQSPNYSYQFRKEENVAAIEKKENGGSYDVHFLIFNSY